MRIAIIIVRILLGGMMVFASLSYFLELFDQPAPTGEMATVMAGFGAAKYLFPLIKITELLCGLSLLSGKFMKVALLALLPITLNIFLLHLCLTPAEAPMAAIWLVANIFLIYANWGSYKHLFSK